MQFGGKFLFSRTDETGGCGSEVCVTAALSVDALFDVCQCVGRMVACRQ